MESVPCVSVSALTAELFEEWTQTLDEFEGQGHRSKLKVTRLKDMISEVSSGLVFVHSVMTRRNLTSHHDVFYMSCHDVMWQKH